MSVKDAHCRKSPGRPGEQIGINQANGQNGVLEGWGGECSGQREQPAQIACSRMELASSEGWEEGLFE